MKALGFTDEESVFPHLGGDLLGSSAEKQVSAWVKCHGDMVLRLAFSLLGDKGQAEDVFQDTFYRAYKHAGRLADLAKVRSWLLRLAANLCRDLQRSSWWRRFRPGFIARNDLLPQSRHGIGEYSLDRAELASIKDTRSAVAKAVSTLPPDKRVVITLYYFEELSCLEIADNSLPLRTHTHPPQPAQPTPTAD